MRQSATMCAGSALVAGAKRQKTVLEFPTSSASSMQSFPASISYLTSVLRGRRELRAGMGECLCLFADTAGEDGALRVVIGIHEQIAIAVETGGGAGVAALLRD